MTVASDRLRPVVNFPVAALFHLRIAGNDDAMGYVAQINASYLKRLHCFVKFPEFVDRCVCLQKMEPYSHNRFVAYKAWNTGKKLFLASSFDFGTLKGFCGDMNY